MGFSHINSSFVMGFGAKSSINCLTFFSASVSLQELVACSNWSKEIFLGPLPKITSSRNWCVRVYVSIFLSSIILVPV